MDHFIDIDENDNPIYADSKYNLNFTGNDTIDASTGTTTQYVAMNNDIINAETVTVEGTTLKFGAFQHEGSNREELGRQRAFVAALNEDGLPTATLLR